MADGTASKDLSGGCQCGAVRYRLSGSRESWDGNLCHCRMCQKASGGPFMAFVNVPGRAVVWTRGDRATFASSSLARRGFCRDCGTPLTYEKTADRMSLALGTLDDPAAVTPQSQLMGEAALPWSGHVADLPVEALDAWLAAQPVAIVSLQHPDRDP